MKLKHKIFALMATAGIFVGCTDGFETINQDPNKIYEVNLQSIFPGTVYRTMNVISEANYNRLWSFGHQVTYIPGQNLWGESGDGYYRQFYVEVLRDLNALEAESNDDPAQPNTNAIAKTWKAFVYYQMLSLYGPVGLTQMNFEDDITFKREFMYDTEETAYMALLDMLDTAVELFDPDSGDKLTRDPVYDNGNGSDIERWRKLANTLRLEIAMNIQNISEDKSREYAAKSMAHEDWLFSSLDDAFAPQYGTVDEVDNSFYYRRLYKTEIINGNGYANIPSMNEYYAVYMFSYDDPRMEVYFRPSNDTDPDATPYLMPDTITRAHNCDVSECVSGDRSKHLQWMAEGKDVRDSLVVRYNVPYVPTSDSNTRKAFNWQEAYDPTDPNGQRRVDDPLSLQEDPTNRCFIQERFYASDIKLPLLRWCDACFLAAEASVKYGLGSKTAQQYYEDGIRASFEEWGIIDKVDAYINQPGIQWATSRLDAFDDTRRLMNGNINGANGDEGKLEQIYKQRWFADFLDGFSTWRMERRTRALDLPPFFFGAGSNQPEGFANAQCEWQERLYFPDIERNINPTGYYDAIEKLQANSPAPNDARWGDNIYTVLQFAKPVPNKAEKIEYYENMTNLYYNMDMCAHWWGDTWEEMLTNACTKLGITGTVDPLDELTVLNEAYALEIRYELRTYYVGQTDFDE